MASDSLFAQVGLLLHGDGADAGTTIVDSSGAPKTPSSSSATTSTAQSKFGGASLLFANGGSSLVYDHSAAIQPTGDFCVEAFFRLPTSAGATRILCWKGISTGAFAYNIYVDAGGYVIGRSAGAGGAGVMVSIASTAPLSANTWHHVAYDRNGSTFRLFVNGVLAGTATNSGAVDSNSLAPLAIGATSASALGLGSDGAAYIDELRVTLASRYTAAFTPPTEAFGGPPAYVLSGVVKDSAGAAAARLVRAYNESTGALAASATSNATTGAYSITTPFNGAHTLVFYPGGSDAALNALVLRGVVPV